ncbi:DUF6907 domain-containing protein [Streptomyces sp. NPDC002276]
MTTKPEGTEIMQNKTALSVATTHLVDTDETPATFRARPAQTGASNQQRARAGQPTEDGAREHREDYVQPPCHMYPGLCTSIDGDDGDAVDEHGRHIDHGGDAITVPSGPLPYDDPEIWADFTRISTDVPEIRFMGESLTPEQTHEKARQLRAFANSLDGLATQVTMATGSTAAPEHCAEQCIDAFLHVGIMNDPDDGLPTLVAATESDLGDLDEIVPARARSMVAAIQAKLDEQLRLINEFEARDTLAAILAEEQLEMEVLDPSTLSEQLRNKITAFYAEHKDGQRILVVPAGQDPIVRLNAVCALLNHQEATAQQTTKPQVAAESSHWSWCEPGECVVEQYEDGDTYVEHYGTPLVMPVPEGMDCRSDELLYAQLGCNENFVEAVPTVSFNSGGNGVLLDADELDTVIGNLTRFTDGLRTMRYQMACEEGSGAGVSTAVSADAARIIEQLEANHAASNAAGLGSPALDAFHREVVQAVAESPNPQACISQIADLLASERGGTSKAA